MIGLPRKRKGELYRILVTGRGPFPIDMLRYDSAYPASERDSGRIIQSLSDFGRLDTSIEIVSSKSPTEERWRSFGWHVTEIR